MPASRHLLICILLCASLQSVAQSDTAVSAIAKADTLLTAIQDIPKKYLTNIDDKLDKYTSRVTSKTEKTLTKLAKWETKIKTLLEKVSPETAQRLFNNNQLTFTTALEKYKQGQSIITEQRKKYNEYRDKLTTSIKYLEEQKDKLDSKLLQPLAKAKEQLNKYETTQDEMDAMEDFIRQRKNELIDEAVKYIGKNRALIKLDKEAYYYVETIRNYKELFSDKKKAEEVALKILNKIPAFKKFAAENSQLANFFAPAGLFPAIGSGNSIPIVNGLAPRSALQQFIQVSMPSSVSTNPVQLIQQQLADAGSLINKWKNKLNEAGGMKNASLPDFTPNTQRSKKFTQRFEFGTDIQFGNKINFLPATSEVSIKAGYKLNDKNVAGIGINYKIGLGNGWNNVKITNEGIGLRTYLKMKLKKSFDIQGGSEWNYFSQFKNIEQLRNQKSWQQSALLGLSRNYPVSKKLKGNIQLLYDFLHNYHTPHTQPFLFRIGYGF